VGGIEMGVKCLGQVKVEPANLAMLIAELKRLKDEAEPESIIGDKDEAERVVSIMKYLGLDKKRYVPLNAKGETDNSENRCESALERARKKPQKVGEVVEHTAGAPPSLNNAMVNRLWLYDGKLYQTTRNDYSEEQVHLLILDFLDREEKKFNTLTRRFKKD
jgi:hypothetical protein